jgi:hypothetical protein
MEVGDQQRRLAEASNKLAQASYDIAQYNKGQSFTLVCCLILQAELSKALTSNSQTCLTPVVLTASIFSMNHEVFPFIPQTATSFIFLFLAISILSVIMYRVQRYPLQHLGSLVAKARFRWQAGPWPPSLEAPLRYLRGNSRSRPNDDAQPDEKDRHWALWNDQV